MEPGLRTEWEMRALRSPGSMELELTVSCLLYTSKTAKTGNPWLTKVRNTGNLFKGCRYFVHGYVCCVVGHIEASQIDNQENYHDGFYDKGTGKLEIRKDAGSLIFIFLQIAAQDVYKRQRQGCFPGNAVWLQYAPMF